MVVWYDFKAAVDHSDLYGYPFSKFERKGSTEWKDGNDGTWFIWLPEEVRDAEGFNDSSMLFLEDKDTPLGKPSGAMTLKMAQGYTARFFVYTQNAGYFEDNLSPDSIISEKKTGIFSGDSGIFFTLSGDDYLSLDLDEVHTGIGNFRLRLSDEFQNKADPKDINDEAYVIMLWCASDDDLLPPDPTTPPSPDPDPAPPQPNPDPSPPPTPPSPDPDPEDDGDEDDDEDEDEDEKPSQNRFWGILALGAVAVILVWIFTKSDGGGGEGGGLPAE